MIYTIPIIKHSHEITQYFQNDEKSFSEGISMIFFGLLFIPSVFIHENFYHPLNRGKKYIKRLQKSFKRLKKQVLSNPNSCSNYDKILCFAIFRESVRYKEPYKSFSKMIYRADPSPD